VAIIEREWSVTSTTEACSAGTATVRFGLASAKISVAMASSARAAGRCRRQAGVVPTTERRVDTAV
jgi:hypothetical protein